MSYIRKTSSKFGEEVDLPTSSVMTKSQFEALAEMRRQQFAGSGFVEKGIYSSTWGEPLQTNDFDLYVWRSREIMNKTALRWGGDNRYKTSTYNINGVLIKPNAVNHDSQSKILFPDAPDALVVESNSTQRTLEQGDFAILNDLDRNLIGFESVGSWTKDSDTKIHSNESGSHTYLHKLIKGVTYEISYNLESGKAQFYTKINGGYTSYGMLKSGENTLIYTHTEDSLHSTISIANPEDNTVVSGISIKQVKEEIVVALQEIPANKDIYLYSDKIETRPSVSRQDLVFLETWHEEIQEKDIVYPFGNVQYRGSNQDSLEGITEGVFTGSSTYSLFGNWQSENNLVGKGYVWSGLSEQDKVKFVRNPENNVYVDGDIYVQVRYRIRVIKGLGNEWEKTEQTNDIFQYNNRFIVHSKGSKVDIEYDIGSSINPNIFVNKEHGWSISDYDKIFTSHSDKNNHALPIALVQRRNQGAFHPTFNTEGTSMLAHFNGDNRLDGGYEFYKNTLYVQDVGGTNEIKSKSCTFKYQTDRTKCCDEDYSDQIKANGYHGKIGAVSGRPDGLFYDEINERDVQDLRMSALKRDFKELREEYHGKAIAGEIRGKEEETWSYVHPKKFKVLHSHTWSDYYHQAFIIRELDGSEIDYYSIVNQDNAVRYIITGSFGNKIDLKVENSNGIQWPHPNNSGSCYMYIDKGRKSIRGGILEAPFEAGEIITLTIIYKKTSTENNHRTQCDIIGDPRKIKDRVNFEITEDTTKDILKNQYILCSSNSLNSGTLDTVYRAKKDLLGILTDSEDGDANIGHIDFSDTGIWVNLGSDNVGGYPEEWLEHGVDGTPNVIDEEGNSSFPVNNNYSDTWSHSNSTYYDGRHFGYKMSHKLLSHNLLLVKRKDGSFQKYSGMNWNTKFGAETGLNRISKSSANVILINVGDTYEDLGYASVDEMMDLMIFKMYYTTRSTFLEIDNNKIVKDIGDVWAGNHYGNNDCTELFSDILGVVPTGRNGTSNFRSQKSPLVNISFRSDINIIDTSGYYGFTEDNLVHNYSLSQKVALKHFNYLGSYYQRAKINYIFKELKYSEQETAKVYFDTGYADNKYILSGDDGEVIIDGPLEHKCFIKGLNEGSKKYIEFMIDDIQVTGGLNVYIADHSDEDNFTLLTSDIEDYLVYSSEKKKRFRIPTYMGWLGRIKFEHNNNEALYIEQFRVIGDDGIKVDSYLPRTHSSYGDDNKFQVIDKINTRKNDNGVDVLYGQKSFNVPYFIGDE